MPMSVLRGLERTNIFINKKEKNGYCPAVSHCEKRRERLFFVSVLNPFREKNDPLSLEKRQRRIRKIKSLIGQKDRDREEAIRPLLR